uniref:Uncharacterized protein n=1 Tax=Timema genevievae TaxID=629358 RepID=A0A7R9JUC7_TIMGE|nr:unnamed protein product [Timema genevievae]
MLTFVSEDVRPTPTIATLTPFTCRGSEFACETIADMGCNWLDPTRCHTSSHRKCDAPVTRMQSVNGSLTPEKKSRSRPPSFVGDSPVNPRSRSSTSDSLKSGSSPNSSYRPVPPPPPPQNRKPSSVSEFLAADLEVPGSVLDWYLVIFL